MITNPFQELVERLESVESQNSLLLKELSTLKQIPAPAEFLTREETAAILQVSLKTLGQWVKNGSVTAYRIGSRVRFRKDEVQASLIQIRTKST